MNKEEKIRYITNKVNEVHNKEILNIDLSHIVYIRRSHWEYELWTIFSLYKEWLSLNSQSDECIEYIFNIINK